jgi:uncharacterized membrane protein YhaH (DUF805 family)
MGIFTGDGRTGRLHYLLVNLAIGFGLVVSWLAMIDVNEFSGQATVNPLYWPLLLVAFWMSAGNMIRRLHDRGHNGYLWLVSLIPIAGFLLGLYLLVAPGDPVVNRYGPPPGNSSRPIDLEAQKRRVDEIAAAAEAAYRSKEASYFNEDGTYNLDGLMTSMPSGAPAPAPGPPADVEPPRWPQP